MTNVMEKGKINTLKTRTWNKNKVEGKDRGSLNSILNIKWQDYTVVMASIHSQTVGQPSIGKVMT